MLSQCSPKQISPLKCFILLILLLFFTNPMLGETGPVVCTWPLADRKFMPRCPSTTRAWTLWTSEGKMKTVTFQTASISDVWRWTDGRDEFSSHLSSQQVENTGVIAERWKVWNKLSRKLYPSDYFWTLPVYWTWANDIFIFSFKRTDYVVSHLCGFTFQNVQNKAVRKLFLFF